MLRNPAVFGLGILDGRQYPATSGRYRCPIFQEEPKIRQIFPGLLLLLLVHSAAAQSLCQTNEKTYFSCRVASSHKTASVCGDVRDFENPRLEYRFGTSKHVELIYPALPTDSLQKFEFHQAISKPDNSELHELFFKNGAYYYGVSSYIADNDHGRVKERNITVFDRDPYAATPLATLRCQDQVIDNLRELSNSWNGEMGEVLPRH